MAGWANGCGANRQRTKRRRKNATANAAWLGNPHAIPGIVLESSRARSGFTLNQIYNRRKEPQAVSTLLTFGGSSDRSRREHSFPGAKVTMRSVATGGSP